MAAQFDPGEDDELLSCIRSVLASVKSKSIGKTRNTYRLQDLSATFRELDRVVGNVVKAKYGRLQDRHKNEMANVYPILERIMERTNRGIFRRLTPRMSKLHPWVVLVDMGMP